MAVWARTVEGVAGSGVGLATHNAWLVALVVILLAVLRLINARDARRSRERREAQLLAALPDAARAGVDVDLADVVRAQMGDPPARTTINKARLHRRLGRSA